MIESGNIYTKPNGANGWVMGHFINPSSPFHTADFEVKFARLKRGEKKEIPAYNKIAKTLTILISGKLSHYFPDEDKTVIIENEGDYLYYDNNVKHTREMLEEGLVIVVRWPSIAGDQLS